MTANNICCYSNEANDRDVVIEFHASRLDGGHWPDLLGVRWEYQVSRPIGLASDRRVGGKWVAGAARRQGDYVPPSCRLIVLIQNVRDKSLVVPNHQS